MRKRVIGWNGDSPVYDNRTLKQRHADELAFWHRPRTERRRSQLGRLLFSLFH